MCIKSKGVNCVRGAITDRSSYRMLAAPALRAGRATADNIIDRFAESLQDHVDLKIRNEKSIEHDVSLIAFYVRKRRSQSQAYQARGELGVIGFRVRVFFPFFQLTSQSSC